MSAVFIGTPAFSLMLHTWTQELVLHLHVHAVMACGVLGHGGQWHVPVLQGGSPARERQARGTGTFARARLERVACVPGAAMTGPLAPQVKMNNEHTQHCPLGQRVPARASHGLPAQPSPMHSRNSGRNRAGKAHLHAYTHCSRGKISP